MKYKLIKPINQGYKVIEQILFNRGIKQQDMLHYLHTSDLDINSPEKLGLERLKAAAAALISCIQKNNSALVVVDADCDGYTSSALLINYLHDLFPNWIDTKLQWFIHNGKQHGLSDCIEIAKDFNLVILPDAGSNDYTYHRQLKELNIPIIILDHHEAETVSEDAIVLNNQLCDYPNKDFSGVGITWQFCRYLDKLLNKNYTEEYLDLVALGLCADMMSLRSIETKHLITKGFREENIKNPFIYSMAMHNSFSLGDKITPMGAAFYIAPYINSMVRSGTPEEKELLFNSMLKHKAFNKIPSTKRGHKSGEMERIIDQAIRVANNVKNRQTRAQDAGLEVLETLIEERHLLDHKVLLLLLEPGQIDRNIAGLIANKFMSKYQRPCCILTRVEDESEFIDPNGDNVWIQTVVSYQGSARGCDLAGVTNFKDICDNTKAIMYAVGHQAAFGLGISEDKIQEFIEKTDAALFNMSTEPVYFVDYIYKGVDISGEDVLDIANLDDIWGKDMEEPYIAVEGLKVSENMVTLMSPDKKPTLKITLPNKISIIKFGSNQEEYEKFLGPGYKEINIVGRCQQNTWNGWTTPQLLIEGYEIVGQSKFNF